MDCYETKCDDELEKKLNTSMPWLGQFIAAASAICTLAMAADAFNGIRLKKLWFPCKYLSLNATSLTLLAVAMKLPMDLNTVMIKSTADWFPKHISLIFMSIFLCHFTSSLGSMNKKEILANVVALGILVITIAVNMSVQLVLLSDFLGSFLILNIVPTALMMLSLTPLVSLAITVPSTKRSLEAKYQEKHRVALREIEVLKKREAFTIDDQRGYMMKYWVMAETSSPQFVLARSALSTFSAVICLFAVIVLATFYVLLFVLTNRLSLGQPESVYGEYTIWIFVIQSIGAVVGIISPIFRWFVGISFTCSSARNRLSFRNGFKIESHWIQVLVDWKENPSALHIHQDKYRKCLHNAKWFAITFCIGLQILTVLLSKLLLLLSALLISRFSLCFTHFKKLMKQHHSIEMISNNEIGQESGDEMDLMNLTHYVLLLEGEAELPRRILKNICDDASNMIQMGKQKQPQNLLNLLYKFDNFHGVGEFDSDQIPSLHSQEPQNIWMLPVVTLASIALAIPNIAKHKSKQLLSSVGEGLSLVKIIEKKLDKNAELVNIRKSAYVTWVGVVLYMKWLDIDLRRMSRNCKNSKELVQELSRKAEKAVMEFKRDEKDSVMENPHNWTTKAVSSNSMYRISRTILLSCENEMDERLFERLSSMIADILAACLSNLPSVITTMGHCNVIEKREKSVRDAFQLLGRTERIVELLQQQEWPSLGHDKAGYIEEWRVLFRRDEDNQAAPSDEMVTTTVEI